MGLQPTKPELRLPKDRVEAAEVGPAGDGGGVGSGKGVENVEKSDRKSVV